MGLFKPYWMKDNMDPEKAAGKLDSESQDMLRQIALEAPSGDIVIAAIRRIKDQTFIKGFVSDDKRRTSIRCDALACLTNPGDLLDCVFETDNEYVRNAADELAAEKLSEKERADYMVRRLREAGDSFLFPKQYVEYLTDPDDLQKIIQHDVDDETRAQAWDTAKENNLQSAPMLALLSEQMAANEKSAKVRWAAVQFTENQDALAYAALHDPEWPIRETAVSKLTDQKALAEVAVNDTDEKIRGMARAKVEKESLLRKAQRQHEHKYVTFTLYEKNVTGRMEPLTDFRKCTICGQYFCRSDLYRDEPFCNYPWTRSHIDTSRDGERVCFTCEETGDSLYGYIQDRNPGPIF